MKPLPLLSACLIALPLSALAATRTYNVSAFEAVSAAAGVTVEIQVGATRSVTAETTSADFDDLKISVEGKVLRIGRPTRVWLFSPRPTYHVRVVTPVLRTVEAASGADVSVAAGVTGDISLKASSGGDLEVHSIQGGKVKASASSGSDLSISGSCVTLEAESSGGADLDAGDLNCQSVIVEASSGSDVEVRAMQRVSGKASSGSDVKVAGTPSVVEIETSSGADVKIEKR